MNAMTINPFRQWFAAGYRDLIPVVPPDAPLSEKSHIALNKSAGKAPGVRYPSGLWGGLKGWHEHMATEADIEAWGAMGASVGLRRGEAFMLDIDATDETTADAIEAAAIAELGPAPLRVGRWPKRALLYRADGHVASMKLTFTGPDGATNQIETPGQVVVQGIHPGTGKPYRWPRKPCTFDELTTVSSDQLQAFIERQRRILPAAEKSVAGVHVDRARIDQETLKGDLKWVRLAMENMPNTAEHFPHYDDMIRVGQALHAALADHPEEARELWHLWGEKWEGGDYEYEGHERRWCTLQAPHAFGYDWLLGKAANCGVTVNRLPIDAARHFDTPDAPLVEIEREDRSGDSRSRATPHDTYPVLTLADLRNRPKPTWLIDRHIPEQSLGFLYSAPGVGKTFLTLDMALHIATGQSEWYGDPIHVDPKACVLYITAEGAFDFNARVTAWCTKNQIDPDKARFALIEQAVNFLDADAINKLCRTIDATIQARPALIVVDTVSRALPGADENLQKEMTRFVAACDLVKERYKTAVLGIHHAGKSGDMRGSTVLLGAGDYVFRLDRKKGASVGRLTCEKMKAAPDGWDEPYRFDTVALPEGETSLAIERADMSIGPSRELTPEAARAVLNAMRAAQESGAAWSRAPQSKDRFAVRRMVEDHGFDALKAEETLSLWERSGMISFEIVDAKKKVKGYRVLEGVGQDVLMDGVFD